MGAIHGGYRKAVTIVEHSLPSDDSQLCYLRRRAASSQPGTAPGHERKAVPELRTIYEDRDHLGPEHSQTIRTRHSLRRALIFADGEQEGLEMLEKVKFAVDR